MLNDSFWKNEESVKIASKKCMTMVFMIRIHISIILLQNSLLSWLTPKRPGLMGGVILREIKFVLSNFLSSEDPIISYKS